MKQVFIRVYTTEVQCRMCAGGLKAVTLLPIRVDTVFFLDLFDTNTNLLLLYLYVQPLKMWYLKQLISYISFDVMTRWAIENKEFFMLFKVEYQKSPD